MGKGSSVNCWLSQDTGIINVAQMRRVQHNYFLFSACWVVISFPPSQPGALELADCTADLPGLKWMPGVTSWKVLEMFSIQNDLFPACFNRNLCIQPTCLHSWWRRKASGTQTGQRFPAVVTRKSAPPCSPQKTPKNELACSWRDGMFTLVQISNLQWWIYPKQTGTAESRGRSRNPIWAPDSVQCWRSVHL